MDNGLYHGEGKLITKESIYEGSFDNGDKHGFGTEIFPKTGLKLTGKFYHGYFDTKNQGGNSPEKVSTSPKMFKVLDQEEYDDYNWRKGFSQGVEYEQKMYESRNLHPTETNLDTQEILPTPAAKSPKRRFPAKREMDFFDKTKFSKTSYGTQASFKKSHQQLNLPPAYQEFDHSFDANSRQDTEISNGLNSRMLGIYGNDRTKMDFSNRLEMIEERLETNQFEDPLPVPVFLQK